MTTGLRCEEGMRPCGSSGEADSFSMAASSVLRDSGLPETTIASHVLTSETIIELAASSFRRLFVPATSASRASGLRPSTASIGDGPLLSLWLRIVWQRVPCQKRYVTCAPETDRRGGTAVGEVEMELDTV
eukprot:COSAG06_NODE_4204_length_4480_cov_3.149509_2_plen_131_part_00